MDEPLTLEQIHLKLLERFDGTFAKLKDIPDPTTLHDGLKAAKRIALAINRNEKIALVGDYDVDGVTSTAIMIDFFKRIPYPLEATIPNRFKDGYGISASIIDRLDATLIITVDNGINALEAALVCKARTIDLIITDHHTPGATLPDAYAIVNPKLPSCGYSFKEICGAQVAWLLLGMVKNELGLALDMRSYLDLLSIAIIADVMPLIGINRVMVQKGLELLNVSQRPAIEALRLFLDKTTLNAEDIGFQIAPRLNSAGRLEDASLALRFLAATDVGEALEALEYLNKLNTYRKDIEAQTTKEAISLANPNDTVIVVAQKGWHEGVVGIVAARLVGHFQKPAIVLSINETGIAKGSARSIGAVSLYTLLDASKAHLLKFGGHKMAAGISLHLDALHAFKATINAQAQTLPKSDFIPHEAVLGSLKPAQLTFELMHLLENFEPFGEGNPRPKFLLKEICAQGVKRFGQDKSHLGFVIPTPHIEGGVRVVGFKNNTELTNGQTVSLSFSVAKNEFNGSVSIQLMLDKLYHH